jgi:hypothetical protein
MRANGIACGALPTVGTVSYQFVSAAGGTGLPATATRNSSFATAVTIDHASLNLNNYQGDAITTGMSGGYGNSVTWNGSVRNVVTIRQRVFAHAFDYSISGSLAVMESSGAGTRTVSGTLTTYDNRQTVEGTTSFQSVVYQDGCCVPVGGAVSTLFGTTSGSSTSAGALNGKTETLQFNGCGSGTLKATNGVSLPVSLSECL